MPEMTPVTNSSNIAAIGHDGEALWVEFASGGTYSYPGVPVATMLALQSAPSPGSFFFRHIKKRYEHRKEA